MTALTYGADTFTDTTTDAGFRQWGSTVSSHFAAAGLVQTADSGQINWTTVTVPAAGAFAGFEVWRFSDPLQSTAPIFIRIQYGRKTVANGPATTFQVGIATNGAGTLTGLSSDLFTLNVGNISGVAGSYASKVCCVDGFFGCSMYRGAAGASNQPICGFIVQRTMDDSGAWTAEGCAVTYPGNAANASAMQALNFIKGTKSTQGTVHTMFPSGTSNTLTDDASPNYQVARSYQPFPKVRPLGGSCGVYSAEIGIDTQFQAALIGTTLRNFISCGPSFGTGNAAGLSNWYIAMLWE